MGLIKKKVRYLRINQTESESLLWQKLRNRKLLGYKFLRQYPICFMYYDQQRLFIADFYCAQKKLVIELDGHSHDNQKDYDELRTQIITNLGMRVMRFTNNQVMENIEIVLDQIKKVIQ